ncbi:ABC transporter ATP-binding protein [Roseovarius sp. LXJ103]|uniref:ABC transporter ATP-binding protein n=1 Tax=Roseovarius carneus TaxID=2853164 RepID=UPI000D60772C|nr:ABC transporter ATP-binding protein [Roseovarius carneus]MBZ8117174.1 ABC transporter ATP-binding protein [Roseovarius carneus]PWE36987.1 ABC transporter ATP-binding protein [Pelagicola sp. LXJ1103]
MNAPGLNIRASARIGETQILPALDLQVAGGAWTCLLGASGVGKSTLLRLIAGVADGVTLDGSITATDATSLKGRIAMMAQSDLLMPWLTITQNVTLGARLRGTAPDAPRAEALLEQVGLAEHAGKRPEALSGGQRQRAALARTLMEDRPLVLLDEPFSALDARTRAQVQDLTADLLKGRTVLMVTHDPAEAARLADHITILTEECHNTWPAPSGTAPRPVDDPAMLNTTGALLARLRAA